MKNFFNNIGSFVGNLVNNASSAASAAWEGVREGYEATTKAHFSQKEQWVQVKVESAQLKGSVIFIHAKEDRTGKTVTMTIATQGQYKDTQLKKLGALLAFMGQCPVETAEQACTAISQAPEKRLLVLLKGWKQDPTLANVVRVQAHDHVAKAQPSAQPQAEPKAKAKGKAKAKAPVQELDESC